MVAREACSLEWQSSTMQTTDYDNQLTSRLGGSLQWNKDWGPWGHPEQGMHINCLELLAATLAVKTFLKDLTGMTVIITIGQPNSCGLYKQHGGHSISPTHTSSHKMSI